jgi:ribonuclease VapC
MVIDTSAIIAILQLESEAVHFSKLIEADDTCLMSAVSYFEAGILASTRRGSHGARELDGLVREANISITPFDEDQAILAREAYARYGKGIHPAGLNFADCASYALAKGTGEALLFKGSDFQKTDVTPASRERDIS